jgi:hypothetical protein
VIVRASAREHHPWLLERIGLVPTPYFRAIEVVDAQGAIRAMAGFDGWSDGSVQMHVAVASPLALRTLVPAAFDFVFVQCGRLVALATVAASNARALKLDAHLGFREVYRVRDGHAPGDDLVLLEMRRDECRWIAGKE